ncbi:unnamed protein product [Didymodactylos carnosus]|uniref:Uncharacterized protein n=1 Tax=Didymodactylos carnosus TaxID=1234261 RepID=A0A814GV41_9BILA|nr:unnamed protein product [Didymodactylos carnosus]CAF3773708.1 unnamed protein product [Didymodactylos carnosus]
MLRVYYTLIIALLTTLTDQVSDGTTTSSNECPFNSVGATYFSQYNVITTGDFSSTSNIDGATAVKSLTTQSELRNPPIQFPCVATVEKAPVSTSSSSTTTKATITSTDAPTTTTTRTTTTEKQAAVVIPSPGDLWQDSAKLIYAPYVLVISAGSSFALWSTLANVGQHANLVPEYWTEIELNKSWKHKG